MALASSESDNKLIPNSFAKVVWHMYGKTREPISGKKNLFIRALQHATLKSTSLIINKSCNDFKANLDLLT